MSGKPLPAAERSSTASANTKKTTGERLSSRPEGFTVKSGSLSLIFYDDRIQSRERINWTLAHELGHVCLRHTSDGKREESEANRFAAAFLMPEDVLRFLDCSLGRELTPTEMTHYFPVSLTAAKRRRYSLPSDATAPTPEGIELVRRLFEQPSLPLSDFSELL